ncbi:MAG: AmpG family muropeptide MFS transporter [Ignavibacteriales bacterium]|nr:AmpG family muropeptide MFS transporter [Ignavibacteriales bacterium]
MANQKVTSRNPWAWVPSLYFAEGMPYVVVMTVSVIMYKRLGISNTDIALYTSWLYLPWVIKPLWSPVVDIFKTKRFWIVTMQIIIGGGLAGVALTLPMSSFFQYTLAFLWLMAFSSATHDIAADGFYMLGLEQHQQAALVGVRSAFYRVATIAGQGLFVVIAGHFEQTMAGNNQLAWSMVFIILAILFSLFFVYHKFILPYPDSDKSVRTGESGGVVQEFLKTFTLFFKKKNIIITLAFLLLYRFAEAQLVKLVSPFLLDDRLKGGLGLSTSEVGIVYGTVGILALTFGGLLGGYVVSRHGLKFWLWIMVCAIHLPDAMFVYLSQIQPENFFFINLAVAVEQFGYGFGFTAYMMYMIMISEGEHKTAHYAICTGFMAMGMMLPGMFSGMLQDAIGYKNFFLWVMLSTIPGFLVAAFVKIDPQFGKKVQK